MQAARCVDHRAHGVGIGPPIRTGVGLDDSECESPAVECRAHPSVVVREITIPIGAVADADRQHSVGIRVIHGHLIFGDICEQSVCHGTSIPRYRNAYRHATDPWLCLIELSGSATSTTATESDQLALVRDAASSVAAGFASAARSPAAATGTNMRADVSGVPPGSGPLAGSERAPNRVS